MVVILEVLLVKVHVAQAPLLEGLLLSDSSHAVSSFQSRLIVDLFTLFQLNFVMFVVPYAVAM